MPSIKEVKTSFIFLALALVIGPPWMYKRSLLELELAEVDEVDLCGAMFSSASVHSRNK